MHGAAGASGTTLCLAPACLDPLGLLAEVHVSPSFRDADIENLEIIGQTL